jgi:hypothetical protein
MRRLRRIALNTATFLSLALAALTAIECAKSYWIADDIHRWGAPDSNEEFTSDSLVIMGGRADLTHVFIHHSAGSIPTEAAIRWTSHWVAAGDSGTFVDYMDSLKFTPVIPGLRFHKEIFAQDLTNDIPPVRTLEIEREVYVNLWLLLAAFTVLPAIRLRPRHRRPRPGHCLICGYDLRASPTRCPECGRPTPAARAG